MRIFTDTETNGFKSNQIVQLTMLAVEDDMEVFSAYNNFFLVDEMDEKAEEVHGLSLEKLKVLSNGNRFEDDAELVERAMRGKLVIAHNMQFDSRMISGELARCGRKYEPKEEFCTMKHFTDICKLPGRFGKYKWPKLSDLMEFLGVSQDKVLQLAKELFSSDDIDFHDARFDTVALYYCYKYGVNGKYIS